jgi:hypothetical protein
MMAGSGCLKKGTGNVIPVNLQNTKNVGSIYLQFSYNPGVIKVTDVNLGELSKNAMLDYSLGLPGTVVIGIVDSKGISGSGTLVLLGFEVIDKEDSSVLSLDSVELHDATSLVDIHSRTANGSLNAGNSEIIPPVVYCGD